MADADGAPRRIAWVTGASRGVGRGVAMALGQQVDLASSQSSEGVGRAIAALAGDPEVMGLTGQALTVMALAARYGVDVSS